jgi:hypothetical protein
MTSFLEKGSMLKRVLPCPSLLNAITVSILGFVILSLVIRHRRLSHAFQWWQAQQLEEDYADSEDLRNQTLQSLFGIRRQLEQMQPGVPGEPILEELHQCQKNLTNLSDRFFSPYGLESLPLALKDLWREIVKDSSDHSTIAFQVTGAIEPAQISDRWPILAVGESSSFATMNAQLLLIWLRKLLKAALTVEGVEQVKIGLLLKQSRWQRCPVLELTIQFSALNPFTHQQLAQQADLHLVSRMLTQLTPGCCYLKRKDSTFCCVLDWMLVESRFNRFINF